MKVRPYNWKSLLLSAMVMSSKVWDDLSMCNADFSLVCPSFTLSRINELELVRSLPESDPPLVWFLRLEKIKQSSPISLFV